MKKMKLHYLLLSLTILTLGLLSCGSDGGESAETEYEKFLRLSGYSNEKYDNLIYTGLDVTPTYLGYLAFEKNANILHFWLINKNSDKILEYKDAQDRVIQKSDVIGRFYDFVFKSTNFSIQKYDLATFITVGFMYENDVVGANFWCQKSYLLDKSEKLSKFHQCNDLVKMFPIKEISWYNNSVAYSCRSYTSIYDTNGQIITSFRHGASEAFLELYDYTKAVYCAMSGSWATAREPELYITFNLTNYSKNEDYAKLCEFYYNEKISSESFGTITFVKTSSDERYIKVIVQNEEKTFSHTYLVDKLLETVTETTNDQ